ncbi:T9SS type A sorting domain-containing protein [Marinirhabdus gelatinilytica]|uniref:Putative repeat protein (TIGR01451 family)/predicted secreted protein (Por secretion system target) n=1 Tax=Marinirhabdus gelatinilytica TaxID=1703343 RepID=A0A370QK16_9FLAO|nr:T9SS type A sorting domain-containing protein [Marinirhabdus gelatinilytica]RDK88704.1 putative repeat protein (TIGR01451 family)/predicted secreted protein (Por secretion system target) [Marinirhabdus gelatinilytica]
MCKILLVCLSLFISVTTYSQIVNIPDANFKAHLVNYTNPVIDTNGDGEIQVSEAEAVNSQINITNVGVSDLTGLEAFVNITSFNSSGNLFTEIDFTGLNELEVLSLSEEQLELINFSNISNLENVLIQSSSLSVLDISSLINLENFRYRLLNSTIPVLNTLILPNTQTLIDFDVSDTLIENIDFTNFINLQSLRFVRGEISTIDTSNLINLNFLSLTGNNLSTIDVSQNINLNFLSISDQNITSVDISNLPQLKELWFNRSNVSEIDLSNNPLLEQILIYETNIDELDLSIHNQLKSLDISSTMIEEIDLSNTPLIELLKINFLELDTIDITPLSFLSGLEAVYTSLTEIDFSSNVNLQSAILFGNQFENLDFSNSNNLGLLDTTNSLELRSINIKNISLPDLIFFAINNPNLDFICVDDIPLAIAQNYNVPPFTTYVDDCALAGGDLNFIEGTLTYDVNGNNCGAGAQPLNNYLINANNGASNFANTTNIDGEYSVKVSEGTYTTQVLGLPPYYDTTPTTATSTFAGFNQTDTADFCVQPNTTADDLTVSIIPLTEARPGFEADYEVVYENVGTTSLTGEVTVTFSDVQVDFVTSTPAPDNQTNSTLTFNVGTIEPLTQGSIMATFLLEQPPTNQSGQLLPYTVTILPTASDATPEDNEFYLPQIIVNSYDPNDKTCLQGTQVLFEDADKYLHYIIRFQNLGTADAINVRVVDVLDELLDVSTFRVLDASHNMETTIVDGQVDFIFDDINLPPETVDPEGSNGYVTFKIKPVTTVALNDEVANSADIYFDFNAPIVTNTTVTRFVDVLHVEEVSAMDVSIFPNPAKDVLNISTISKIENVTFVNTLGQEVKNISVSENNSKVDVSTLVSGLYFVKVTTMDGSVVKRIVKE